MRRIGTLLDMVSSNDTIFGLMNKKHRRTLSKMFEKPERSDVPWRDIEELITALGGEISEGQGSRVRVFLNGIRAVFHRPHPERTTAKGAIKSVRRFLREAEVSNDGV